jgi:hypothetical protein
MHAGFVVRSALFAIALAAAPFVALADSPCGDVNSSDTVTASDALSVLKKSVGQSTALECPLFPDRYGSPQDTHLNSEFSPDFLLGRPVTLDKTMTVTAFGLITRTGGTQVKMALYDNDGADGGPGTLLVSTGATGVLIGFQEIAAKPTLVPAGTYWVMALYDAITILATDEEASDTPQHVVRYRSLDFADPLPPSFGPASTYGETEINYWVQAH